MYNKMQVERDYYWGNEQVATQAFFGGYINFMILFFPITSFLLIPSVQGTTIITVLSAFLLAILMAIPAGDRKWLFFKDLAIFFAVIIAFSVISQFLNLAFHVKLDRNLVLVNRGGLHNNFFRASHFTQSAYLVVAFIIYLFVKYYANRSVVSFVFWGIRLLCFYGLYEWIFYLATGTSGDFMMNRKFGDLDASLTQTATIGGFNMIRMKGYTGEPSMFTFTTFPFYVLSYPLKRTFDRWLLLCCLILTVSTTAYAAMILFHLAWFFYKKKYKQIVLVLGAIVIILGVLQLDAFKDKADAIYDFVFGGKLSKESESGRQRSSYVVDHFEYWMQLNPLSQLFGIGFGYVRSTDFISTILVNNGLFGFFVFSFFMLKHLWAKITDVDLRFCYVIGLILLYFIMMGSVPEFAYPSLWIYLALGLVFSETLIQSPKYEE